MERHCYPKSHATSTREAFNVYLKSRHLFWIQNWSATPCSIIRTDHHGDVSNNWEDVNTLPPTGHEFHVQHVVAHRPMHRPRSPRLLRLCAGRAAGWSFRQVFIRMLLMQSTPRARVSDAQLPWKQCFRELVMWWMRRGLSGGRCDWGCDVSPNGWLGEDEKGSHTAGNDFQSVCSYNCVCMCACVSPGIKSLYHDIVSN